MPKEKYTIYKFKKILCTEYVYLFGYKNTKVNIIKIYCASIFKITLLSSFVRKIRCNGVPVLSDIKEYIILLM